MSAPNRAAGEIAIAMADLAVACIGPNGLVVQISEEDAPMLRSAFCTRLAEAAMQILDDRSAE